MFKDALRDIVEQVDGGLAGLIMDASGITLERYTKAGATVDIDTVGIEFGVVVSAVKRATEMLEAGAPRELAVTTANMTTIIRMLDDTYFLALALSPEGNVGKGRYLMRTAAPKITAEL